MSRALQLAVASVFSSGLLVGCGQGDAGGGGATLRVVSSSPINGATSVAVDQPFVMEFAEGVQPASLAGNIMLMPGASDAAGMDKMNMGTGDVMDHAGTDMSNMAAIPGTAVCDTTVPDCKKIKFTPLMSLAWGQKYHIMVHQLKTAAGKDLNGLNAVKLEFTTAYVVETKSERNVHLSTTSPEYQLTKTEYKNNGNGQRPTRDYQMTSQGSQPATYTYYNVNLGSRTGVDIRLQTGKTDRPNTIQNDDTVVRSYTLPVKNAAGKVVAAIIYKGRGGDGQWGTSDDLASSFTLRNEDHATHRLNSSYKATATAGTLIPIVSEEALKAAVATTNSPWESSGASLGFFQTQPSGAPRLLKQIRFSSLGANKELDIDANGNKKATSDDNIREYQVYEYNEHGSRSARKEYTAPESGATGTSGLSLNETTDTAFLTGYRVYKTANDIAFGNAVGMLRVAEITYASGNFSDPLKENDFAVKDYELNFYCRQTANEGAYEKYEIEVKPTGTVLGVTMPNSQFPNAAIEAILAPNSTNCSPPPNTPVKTAITNLITSVGLTGTVQDISENTRF